MEESSIWLNNIQKIEFPKLNKNMEVDVLIIGGGVSGILCAHELRKRNISYVLVEKEKIGLKTSKDTTAFLTFEHDSLLTLYLDSCLYICYENTLYNQNHILLKVLCIF